MQTRQNVSSEPELHYWGKTPEAEFYKQQAIKASSSLYTSPRGLSLFSRSWLPSASPLRAVVCMIHGYGNDISWTFQSTAIFLAQMGFACFAIDIEGHGRSQGLRAYVPNCDLVVEDCVSFFNFVRQNDKQFNGLPSFLYGESMGGAICLLIHLSNPNDFDGAILVAPMCKIADNIKPRWPIDKILELAAKFVPTLAIIPSSDLMEKSVKVEEKRKIADMNPMRYRGKPRLGTAIELLRVTDELGRRLRDVRIPFIVVHGSADVVTDPNVSRGLFEEAKSEDKMIKIYDGMMHSLLFGETDENVEIVRRDILCWLTGRCNKRKSCSAEGN